MKFLADEDFPIFGVKLIDNAGHDIRSIRLDSPGIEDEEVLELALKEGRIILTFDKDYGELIYHKGYTPPPGLIFFRLITYYPQEPAEILLKLIEQKTIKLEDMFTVVKRNKIRQRPL